MKAVGKKTFANTLIMGVKYQPMRGLSRMMGGAIDFAQLDGLIYMFNGHFFKGLNMFFKAGRARKRAAKAAKEPVKYDEEDVTQ
jgi:beta-glucosidase